jgi:hypothetical protein
MNNKSIGILIAIIYFANYHICKIFYPDGGLPFVKLKVSIYCLIILLAFEYKKQNLLIEKIFLAVIFNNIYVLLFNNETTYSLNDIIFIAWFTAIQYIKHFYNLYKKWSKY